MSQQSRCPRCNSVIPHRASGCAHCDPQATAEDLRFKVVKRGEPFHRAAAVSAPVSTGLPADVRSIGEGAQVWYCRIGGQIIGPVTAEQIRGAFGKGQIDGHASVGIQGKKDWFPIRALPQFSNILTGIGPAPTARPRSAPVPGGAGLPGPQTAHQRAAPMNLPAPARPAAAMAAPMPPAPAPAALPPVLATRPVASADRDDKTEIVPPLPPPGLVPGAQYATPIPSRNLPPPLAVLQDEIKRYRRLAVILGIVSGVLFITTAALLGLLAAG